jgi:hypothetical protein
MELKFQVVDGKNDFSAAFFARAHRFSSFSAVFTESTV